MRNLFQEKMVAAQDLRDQVRETGRQLKINSNASVVLFHSTSAENARSIQFEGEFKGNTWFSASKSESLIHAKPKHGSNTVTLSINIDAYQIEFSTGTGEFYTPNGLKRIECGDWIDPLFESPSKEEKFKWESRTSQPVLTLPFKESPPCLEEVVKINKWVKNNASIYENNLVKLYHATNPSLPILEEGLKPTSSTRRRSFQSESGFVYLANTPERAKTFGDLGNQSQSVVFEVVVLVRKLLPDKDQLSNQRSVGKDIGNSIGESIVYGGGVRIKGGIDRWQIRLYETESLSIKKESLPEQKMTKQKQSTPSFP